LFQKHFLQLLHFVAPDNADVEEFCCKMIHLRSLVLFSIPKSFQCIQNMRCLQQLDWNVPIFTVKTWNQFVDALSGILLRTLNFSSISKYIESFRAIQNCPESKALSTVTKCQFSLHKWNEVRLNETKRLFPQLSHLCIYFGRVRKDRKDIEKHFLPTLVEQTTVAALNSITILYFKQATYYKGDRKVHIC